jgi:hypothetical protein
MLPDLAGETRSYIARRPARDRGALRLRPERARDCDRDDHDPERCGGRYIGADRRVDRDEGLPGRLDLRDLARREPDECERGGREGKRRSSSPAESDRDPSGVTASKRTSQYASPCPKPSIDWEVRADSDARSMAVARHRYQGRATPIQVTTTPAARRSRKTRAVARKVTFARRDYERVTNRSTARDALRSCLSARRPSAAERSRRRPRRRRRSPGRSR